MNKSSWEIIAQLKNKSSQRNIAGMAKFGITTKKAFGVSVSELRKMAKEIGKNHQLALKLWDTGYHEAKILASLIDQVEEVDEKQMDKWVGDFDSWDICDTVCGSLFDKTSFAYKKALKYTFDKREFVKRAGFVIFTWLVVHDKKTGDKIFADFLDIIEREAKDERNFVKKAVNWSLRQIGKRNGNLRKLAIKKAKQIEKQESQSARWIAKDALRELEK